MPPVMSKLVRAARLKHIPRGQIIIYAGDVPQEAFILKSGAIKLYDIDDAGNEKILHIVKPPAVIPLATFSGKNVAVHWFYSTLTDCDLYVLGADSVRRYMHQDPALNMYLVNNFSNDVHELLVRLSSLGKSNIRDKVVAALRFLQLRHSQERRNGWWRVSFAVSHQLLGDLSGITRESASTVMKELQTEGIVRNPRQTILEINRDKLI